MTTIPPSERLGPTCAHARALRGLVAPVLTAKVLGQGTAALRSVRHESKAIAIRSSLWAATNWLAGGCETKQQTAPAPPAVEFIQELQTDFSRYYDRSVCNTAGYTLEISLSDRVALQLCVAWNRRHALACT